MTPPFVALVPAAGRGLRFGDAGSKQWITIAGRPLLAWTLERLLDCGARHVILALPAGGLEAVREILPGEASVSCIVGGETRQESVRLALEAAESPDDELILVHDGVRPAVSEADVRATLAAAAEHGAALLGRSVHDTLKQVADGRVVRTVDRSSLFRAETPQVFRRELLSRAFAAAERDGFVGTDEAALVERLSEVEIRAVEARHPNPKLTRPDQLGYVEAVLQS